MFEERAETSSAASLPISFSVQQVQRGEVEGTYGTGATVWPAAMVMLKYMERQPQLIQGKRVVDLGSGTGVTSLAAAILGASQVVCTDGEEPVVQLAFDNCQGAVAQIPDSSLAEDDSYNNRKLIISNCPIKVEKYWWGADPPPDDHCEVVLVADCLLPKLYPIAPLVQAMDELLQTSSSIGILSYEHRYYPEYDPRDKFRELATTRGLVVEIVDPKDLDPVYNVDDIEVWLVRRKQ